MNYENTIPLYIQISNDMMSKIENNVYKGMLPSEKEFVNIYQVSRVTIRKALDKLEKEKIITRRAGFGTKINSNKDDLKNFTLVKSFTNEMKESGAKNSATFSSSISIVYDNKDMTSLFKCEEGKRLYELKRLRGVNDKAIVYSDTWLNLPIELPTNKEFLFSSLYDYLTSNGIYFSRFEEELEAIIPTKEMRKLLNLDKDGAVLKRIRKGYSESGVLLEYTINYYDAKLYRYSVEVASIEKVR